MIQHTMSICASPMIIVPKEELEVKQEDAKKTLPVYTRPRLVCDYCKFNQKLPADFWSYDWEGQRVTKQGISTALWSEAVSSSSISLERVPM